MGWRSKVLTLLSFRCLIERVKIPSKFVKSKKMLCGHRRLCNPLNNWLYFLTFTFCISSRNLTQCYKALTKSVTILIIRIYSLLIKNTIKKIFFLLLLRLYRVFASIYVTAGTFHSSVFIENNLHLLIQEFSHVLLYVTVNVVH